MTTENNSAVKSSYFKVTDFGIYEIKVRGAVNVPDKVKLVMPKSTFIEAFHKYTTSDTTVDTKAETSVYTEAADHPITVGRQVWFIPEGHDSPYCGHVAGTVIADFETGATKYCIVSDGRYFFSNRVKVLKNVATSKEAAAYFN